MESHLYDIIATYGVYAVFALCMVEGDITLLLSGILANSSFFGNYSFLKVFIFGTLGAMVGDSFGYFLGYRFHRAVEGYRFYQLTQPRIEKLIDKFGGFAIIISKYIYGIRVAMCMFYGTSKMPFMRFLALDAISCSLWVLILSGVGYFFSGSIKTILGDYEKIGIALFFIVMTGVIVFYVVERYWLSDKVEEASPNTVQKIEEKILAVEEAGLGTLRDIGDRLHFTREPHHEELPDPEPLVKKEKKSTQPH
ncbi:MAG: DedA family protein [Pyrinomonadaceae bacterium]|nr:DedA family protein [Pyrinomonadaceae bacterium]